MGGLKFRGLSFLQLDTQLFRAHKAIFSSSVSVNGEVYVPKTSSMRGASAHV